MNEAFSKKKEFPVSLLANGQKKSGRIGSVRSVKQEAYKGWLATILMSNSVVNRPNVSRRYIR